jgi:hypothetical protein
MQLAPMRLTSTTITVWKPIPRCVCSFDSHHDSHGHLLVWRSMQSLCTMH